VLHGTRQLCPLIAIQPLYMHPFAAAKMVASLDFIHSRRVWLNMLAGGFKNDLVALGDETAHNECYARLVAYTCIMRRLLEAAGPVTVKGEYYWLRGLV
jgi:alkanesulfonate monooxygenase